MPEINEYVLSSFRQELSKVADVPWQLLGRTVGSGAGMGAGILGTAGALRGGYRGWRDARAEGADAGTAGLRALGGGAKGGIGGAALGAGLGAAAGGAGALLNPELAARAAGAMEGAPGPLGAFTRFGQRQVHSVTGWKPEGGLEAIRGGAWDQRAHAAKSLEELGAARLSGDEVATGRAARAAHGAEKARAAMQDVENRGMTSIPGALRAIKQDPLGAARAGAMSQWHGSSKAEKALLLGFPAAQLGMAAMSDDPNKGERMGENLGGIAGGLAFGGAPLLGQIAGGVGAGAVGKLVGHGVDKMRARRAVPRKPDLEPSDREIHVPVERGMSPSMVGQVPEVG